MAQVPFSYTKIALDEFFIGRGGLVSYLLTNIENCQSTIVYGQRRVGKSSLIAEAIRQYQKKQKKHFFIQMDLVTCSNSEQFISMICLEIDKLIKKQKPLAKNFQEIFNFISSIRPIAKMDSITGEPQYGIDFIGNHKQIHKTLEDIFDLLESIARHNKLTIVLDEFQSIVDWKNSDQIQWLIRSKVQNQKNIGYIFSGSSKNLIAKLFQEAKRAFYKSSVIIHVDDNIDTLLFSKWIKKRFEQVNLSIKNETIHELLRVTSSHPYYTQKLCYTLWSLSLNQRKNGSIDNSNLELALQTILEMENDFYQERIDRLATNQRKLIFALAKLEPDETLFSRLTINKYSLPVASSIQRALKQLEVETQPLIHKENDDYLIEDPFFRLWLREH
jgi:AAA+ ATPase superfamily predicted ATPase